MLKFPWICSRCARRVPRLLSACNFRFQSTAAASPQLSLALLDRARTIAAEHAKLSAQNAQNYDVKVAKRLGELKSVTDALQEWDGAQNSITELTSLLHDPMADQELRSLAAHDLASTTSSLPHLSTALKSTLIPPHPFSQLPCLIEIHPGAGGSEASLFAAQLLRMYQSFCSRIGWRTSMLKEDRADSEGGVALVDAVMEVHAPGSYDILRVEAGVHRVQRVPATEKKGRTHTSAVSVLVLPSLPDSGGEDGGELDYDNPNSDYFVNSSDVRSETMRARGAGGQHVNTTDSAVRLTHVPTGIVVGMQEERSQHKNREKAWRVLRAKLAQRRREEREEEVRRVRRRIMGGVGKTDRGDKVRTYNFEQNRVSDHRCGVDRRDLEDVLEGGTGLEMLGERVRAWMVEQEVVALALGAEDDSKKREGGGGAEAVNR